MSEPGTAQTASRGARGGVMGSELLLASFLVQRAGDKKGYKFVWLAEGPWKGRAKEGKSPVSESQATP